jgi:hypothetical protein
MEIANPLVWKIQEVEHILMAVDVVITTTTTTVKIGTILWIGKKTRNYNKVVTNHPIRRNLTLLGRRNNLSHNLVLLTLSLHL